MDWVKEYHKGWYIYWHKKDGRFYAKQNAFILPDSKHFHGRYDYLKAMAIARDWIDRKR